MNLLQRYALIMVALVLAVAAVLAITLAVLFRESSESVSQTSSQVMRSVITEKENRAIEVVLSSVRPLQLLTGKVIGQGGPGSFRFSCGLVALR